MIYLLVFAAGFVAGWIVFQRPQWATDLLDKAKEKWRSLRS